MLVEILQGDDPGPGAGWFRTSVTQTRYDWGWLKARDRDGDGSVSPEELGGPAEFFERLDRDRSGAIKPDDLDWSSQSAYLRRQAEMRRRFVLMDTNSNGRISREEWDAFFSGAAKDKAALTLEDLANALDPPAPAAPQGKDAKARPKADKAESKDAKAEPKAAAGPSHWLLLARFLTGELGSWSDGPRVGDLAPDFTLKTHDGKGAFTLSKSWGEKPVVLVFGSFT
jgi:hypothetical protein